MRLVGVHGPSGGKGKLLSLELVPTGASHHELPRNFLPALLPIDAGIVDEHSNLIDASVISDQAEPAPRHSSKLVFVLNEPVIVELVLVDGALVVGSDRVIRAQFLQWDYVCPHALDLHLSLKVPLESCKEETVGGLLDFSDFDVLGFLDGFPMLGMLHVQSFGNVANAVRLGLLLSSNKHLFSGLIIEKFQRLSCVVDELHPGDAVGDRAGIFGEDDGGRAKELALLGQVLDLL